MKKLNKKKVVKDRFPVAPPSKKHKTKKDYNRKEDKKTFKEMFDLVKTNWRFFNDEQ